MHTTTETHALAAEVAQELGALGFGAWTADGHALSRDNGAVLYLSLDRGRAHVSVGYPATSERPDYFTCSTALDRGPAAVARDITRRVLPGYLPELARIVQCNDAPRADFDARGALLEQVAQLFGSHYTQGKYDARDHSSYTDRLSLYQMRGEVYGGVEVSGTPERFTVLELRQVKVETAFKILALLAEDTDPEK